MTAPVIRHEQRQHQTLTPRLQQAVRLLQLSSLDFALEVNQAMGNNPFLEPDEAEAETVAAAETNAEPTPPVGAPATATSRGRCSRSAHRERVGRGMAGRSMEPLGAVTALSTTSIFPTSRPLINRCAIICLHSQNASLYRRAIGR